jgi:hypothetical protein
MKIDPNHNFHPSYQQQLGQLGTLRHQSQRLWKISNTKNYNREVATHTNFKMAYD